MAGIAEQVESYIDYKRGLGLSFETQMNCLRQFVRYADSIDHEGPIDVELACSWARSGTGHTRGYENSRYEEARRLSDFCRAFDETLPKLPPGLLGKMGDRVEPYIYSDEDISLLMYAAGSMRLPYAFSIMRLHRTGIFVPYIIGNDLRIPIVRHFEIIFTFMIELTCFSRNKEGK